MAEAPPSLPPASATTKKKKPVRCTSYPLTIRPANGPPPPTPDFDACRALLGLSIEQCKKEMELVFEANEGPNSNVIIFRKKDPKSGAFLYRMKGAKPYSASAFVATQMNDQYKEHWNEYIESVQTVDRSGSSELFRFVMKFPFPFSNREYVYRRWARFEPSPNGSGSRTKPGTLYLCMGGVFPQDDHRVAPNSSLVRVETSSVSCAVRALGPDMCEYVMESLDDPKMSIPKWLFNWFVKTGIPRIRIAVDKAAAGYAEYMATYECEDYDESKFLVKMPDAAASAAPKTKEDDAPAEEAAAAAAPDSTI